MNVQDFLTIMHDGTVDGFLIAVLFLAGMWVTMRGK